MKSKFILNGGFQKGNTNEDNTLFYSEILKDVGDNSKVLIVPFAKDPERVVQTTERVMDEFNKVKGSKNLSFEIANKESFTEQVKSSNVIYIQGGNTLKLMGVFKKFHGLKDLLVEGKTVAGESAGANALCTLFYSPSADGIYEGLGILPIKIIPHYTNKYEGIFNNTALYLDSLYLKEYEYKVL
ncbi:MAG: Type 1 glutamine amidotransferase-like domain-containing protein [Candidatus Paceibacterota bacterium]